MVIEGVVAAGLVAALGLWAWRRKSETQEQVRTVETVRERVSSPSSVKATSPAKAVSSETTRTPAERPLETSSSPAPATGSTLSSTVPVQFSSTAPEASGLSSSTVPVNFTPAAPEAPAQPSPTVPVNFSPRVPPEAPLAPSSTVPVNYSSQPPSSTVPVNYAAPSVPVTPAATTAPTSLSFGAMPQRTPEAAEQESWTGRIVGGYTLLEKLGEGGMAVVYKVRSKDNSRDLALKILQEPFASDPVFQQRIAREVATCKDLRHPNIMSLFDWSPSGAPVMFLALEYVDGDTLLKRLRGGGLNLDEIAYYMGGLLEGLAYAHQRGIVHRDLKPENVMLTSQGVVKIADFGLARTQDGEKITRAGQSMGTPAYFPPEQIVGADPTPAADQYSVGVMLYEMLTGKRPFKETHPIKMLMCHMSEKPTDPLVHRPDLPPVAAALALRMMEKQPDRRFSSLLVVKQGLEALARGEAWEIPESERLPENLPEVTSYGDGAFEFPPV